MWCGVVLLYLSGDVHSPAAFFFFFCFILHIHIFFFKVAHKELLLKGMELSLLKIATFGSLLLPFIMLIIGEIMLMVGDQDSIYVFLGVNNHVVVEYVVTVALAFYIYSFRNDVNQFSLSGHFCHDHKGFTIADLNTYLQSRDNDGAVLPQQDSYSMMDDSFTSLPDLSSALISSINTHHVR